MKDYDFFKKCITLWSFSNMNEVFNLLNTLLEDFETFNYSISTKAFEHLILLVYYYIYCLFSVYNQKAYLDYHNYFYEKLKPEERMDFLVARSAVIMLSERVKRMVRMYSLHPNIDNINVTRMPFLFSSFEFDINFFKLDYITGLRSYLYHSMRLCFMNEIDIVKFNGLFPLLELLFARLEDGYLDNLDFALNFHLTRLYPSITDLKVQKNIKMIITPFFLAFYFLIGLSYNLQPNTEQLISRVNDKVLGNIPFDLEQKLLFLFYFMINWLLYNHCLVNKNDELLKSLVSCDSINRLLKCGLGYRLRIVYV